MKLYIPTRGRAGRQSTYRNLPPEWQKKCQLVVDADEVHLHEKDLPLLVLPDGVTGLGGVGKVRQWLMETTDADKLCMLDDDLRFDLRREDDPGKFGPASNADVSKMFDIMERTLDEYAHVGVTAREGGNRHHGKVLFNTRMMRVIGLNKQMYFDAGIRFDRIAVMEDFDVTLQFLRKGHPNVVLNKYIQGQGSSNSAGGCSLYRTMEVHEAGAKKLQELHPDFVRLVKKTTKSAWGGGERTDVMIQWKKAFESSGRTL